MAIATEQSLSFVPNNTYFFLPSDDINDGYFYDNVHVTLKGSDKLAISMGLEFRNNLDTCSKLSLRHAPAPALAPARGLVLPSKQRRSRAK